jgi:hypothetical protein
VKALDTLTPLGRGASLLVIGPHNSGKTTLAVDAILGQRSTGVKCVMSSTTLSAQQLEQRLKVRHPQHGRRSFRLSASFAFAFTLPCTPLSLRQAIVKTGSGTDSSMMEGQDRERHAAKAPLRHRLLQAVLIVLRQASIHETLHT